MTFMSWLSMRDRKRRDLRVAPPSRSLAALKIGGEGTDVPCAASTGGWMVMRVKSNYAVAGTAVYPSSASCLTR